MLPCQKVMFFQPAGIVQTRERRDAGVIDGCPDVGDVRGGAAIVLTAQDDLDVHHQAIRLPAREGHPPRRIIFGHDPERSAALVARFEHRASLGDARRGEDHPCVPAGQPFFFPLRAEEWKHLFGRAVDVLDEGSDQTDGGVRLLHGWDLCEKWPERSFNCEAVVGSTSRLQARGGVDTALLINRGMEPFAACAAGSVA